MATATRKPISSSSGVPIYSSASPAIFVFVFVCPGLAVVRLLPLRDHLEQAVLAVALANGMVRRAGRTQLRPLSGIKVAA